MKDVQPAQPSDKATPSTQVAQDGTPWGDIHKHMSSKPEPDVAHKDKASQGKDKIDSELEQLVRKSHADLSKATGMPVRTSTEAYDAMGKQAVDTFKNMEAQIKDPQTSRDLRKETIDEMNKDLKILGIPTKPVPGSKDGELEPVHPLTPESMTQAIIKDHAAREGLAHGRADEFMKNLNKLGPAEKEKELKKVEYGNYKLSNGSDTD